MGSTRHRTGIGRRTAAGPIDSKAEAITELMLEVAQCFFKIRALGQKTGFITGWGGGAFGFMRSLALLGPLTVPQIAQMRPTSRQRMQRLANELAAEGLVEFIDNPKHRRSKLVRLTPKGDARYRELDARLLSIASTMGGALGEADIRKATRVGVEAVCQFGAENGIRRISAGNYGGKLGQFQFHLRDIMNDVSLNASAA